MADIDEVQTVGDVQFTSELFRITAVVNQTSVERMVLDDEPGVGRCMKRKRTQHLFDRIADAVERRMNDDLRVGIQLQREDVIRMAVVKQFTGDLIGVVRRVSRSAAAQRCVASSRTAQKRKPSRTAGFANRSSISFAC